MNSSRSFMPPTQSIQPTGAKSAPAAELGRFRLATRTKSVHLWVGFGGALVFWCTGIIMVIGFPALYGDNEAIRYMYRANHVYILLGSLINIAVGVYRTDLRLRWRGRLALVGSVLLWVAPFVLLFAFFFEPPRETPLRLATFLGTLMLLIGVLAQWPNRALKSARADEQRRLGLGLRSLRRAARREDLERARSG